MVSNGGNVQLGEISAVIVEAKALYAIGNPLRPCNSNSW